MPTAAASPSARRYHRPMSQSAPTPSEDARLRAAMCAAGRRLGVHGLVSAAEGNLSLRLSGGRLLTTPTGRRKDELGPEDLATVPLYPETGPPPAGPPPSSDIAIHRAIYRARPDVIAIAHAHLPASMALTLAGEVPDPAALPETAYHLPVLPFVPYGAMGSEELAGRIAAAFAGGAPPLPGWPAGVRPGEENGTGRPLGADAAGLGRAWSCRGRERLEQRVQVLLG